VCMWTNTCYKQLQCSVVYGCGFVGRGIVKGEAGNGKREGAGK